MSFFDAVSFNELYDKYYADVFRFAYWLSGNRDEAQDIASETFTKVWTIDTELKAQTVKGYMLTIARNIYLQGLKKNKEVSNLSEEVMAGVDSSSTDLETDAEMQATTLQLVKALQALEEPDRSILIMKTYEGMSYQEISSIYGMTISTLKIRVHRARVKLALSVDYGE